MTPAGEQLLQRFVDFIVTPAIFVVFAAGFFLFVWGLVQFIWNIDEGAQKSDGVRHMIWGILGMVIMVSVQGILMLLDNTFDLNPFNPEMGRLDNSTPRFDIVPLR